MNTTTTAPDLNSSISEATRFVRNNLSGSLAAYGYSFDVVNIDSLAGSGDRATLVLDLNDGTTIRLDIERYAR